MKILDSLCTKCVIPDMEADSKDQVLALLADHAIAAEPTLQRDKVLTVLKERELLGSTGIGGGIAIPHGKLSELSRLILIVARSLKGVPFDTVDKKPVHAVFLLLAPDDSATLYLRILARISRLLKTEGVYEKILAAENAQDILGVIFDIDETL